MRKAKYIITEQEYAEVKRLEKQNKHKSVNRRLQVIILRYEGMKDSEIARKLNYSSNKTISRLCTDFKKQGLAEYARHKYGGNNQAVDSAKEKEILDSFREKAESGKVVTAADIKRAFDEHRGKDTGRGYIYMLLERHNWRMVMPRGKHPKGANEAEIEASKKLTPDTKN